MRFILDMLTGIDGRTIDPARVFWIVGVIAFLGFTAFDLYKGNHFDMMNYGTAYAMLLASGAVGVRIKAGTEPTA